MTTEQREQRTIRYENEILARVQHTHPLTFSPRWFDDRILYAHSRTPPQQRIWFRFLSALPRLQTPSRVMTHLRDALHTLDGLSAPGWWRRLRTALLPTRGPVARLFAWACQAHLARLRQRFIPAATMPDVLAQVARQRQQHTSCTVEPLVSATLSENEADHVARQFTDLLHHLEPLQINREVTEAVQVSLDLATLTSRFDPLDTIGTTRRVTARLRPIFRLARQTGAKIAINMGPYATKALTLHIVRTVLGEAEFRDWPNVSITLQAYLPETECDLTDLLMWVNQRGTAIGVRLVKGGYASFEINTAATQGHPSPIWPKPHETDACFERCTQFLLEHHTALRPAFATHDVRAIAAVLATAEEWHVPAGAFELEMHHGVHDELKDALCKMNHRLRVYTPFGPPQGNGAYLVWRLSELTHQPHLRAIPHGDTHQERLHMSPQTAADLLPFRHEPRTDFSKPENQQKMLAALDRVRYFFGRTYPLIIHDRPVMMTHLIDSFNPSDQSVVIGRSCRATAKQATEAITAAKGAFPAWRDLGSEARCGYINKVTRLLRDRRFELAAWIVYECGKTWREADAEVTETIDFCTLYTVQMNHLTAHTRRQINGEENQTVNEGCGVAVVIAPWNNPLSTLCRMTVAALITGNTVIMKPAEQTPIIAAKLMDIFQAVGLPRGVIHYLPGVGDEIGPTLVRHPDVAVIAFSGSWNVGQSIRQHAANAPTNRHHAVKKVIAEIRGNNAVIIDDDADLDAAIPAVIGSAFGFAGQQSSAWMRVIVLEQIYDAFISRFIDAVKSIPIGSADQPSTVLGPVIDPQARERILAVIERSQANATLAYAGKLDAQTQNGSFVAPHVLINVAPQAAIIQEEIVGPVVAIQKANTLDDALALATGPTLAHSAGFFSSNQAHIDRIKRTLHARNVSINHPPTTPPLPHEHDLLQFMTTKAIREKQSL